MPKFFGAIGFANAVETSAGVWEDVITEKSYYGDIVKNSRRLQSTQNLNDDIQLSNEIHILADPFANQNFHQMKYVTYMYTKWKITNVEVSYPRLILSMGGVYTE
ncbi:MAG: hypothetical protein R3Y53_02020 [Bacillota bacterium]